MNKKLIGLTGLMGLALVLAGCSGPALPESSPQTENDGSVSKPRIDTAPAETATVVEIDTPPTPAQEAVVAEDTEADIGEVTASSPSLVPQEAPPFEHELAESGYSWSQLLAPDSIMPIYEAELELTEAENAPYDENELVIGVEINGEARAYAIGPLNSREMVNDTVGGVPILVTW